MTSLSLRLQQLHPRRVLGTLVLALAHAACDGATEPDPVPASIRLSEQALSLPDAGSGTLTATVLDQRGKPLARPVRWSSSDTAVVVVDTAGVLQARAPGAATVTASHVHADGSALAASAAVTVSPSAGQIDQTLGRPMGAAGHSVASPFHFWVRDRQGRPLPGARVEFHVTRGSGTFAPEAAVTDSMGRVATTLTLGPEVGEVAGEARVAGTDKKASIRVLAGRPQVVLRPDSLRILSAGCTQSFVAYVHIDAGMLGRPEMTGAPVAYSVEDSTLLSLAPSNAIGGTPGLYRDQTRLVTGRAAGLTRVIARYGGGADTAWVRVVSPADAAPGQVQLPGPSERYVPHGERVPLGATVYEWGGCPLGSTHVTYTSSNPGVAQVDASGMVTTGQAGDARIVATAGALADTVNLRVRRLRLVPGDTTIRVGDTVNYRLFMADATGVWTEIPRWVHSFSSIAPRCAGARCTIDGLVTGVAPGTARIYVSGQSPYSDLSVETTLQVIPP